MRHFINRIDLGDPLLVVGEVGIRPDLRVQAVSARSARVPELALVGEEARLKAIHLALEKSARRACGHRSRPIR
eukprot:1182981-Prorocentrum_minimum.AAC.1